MLKPVRFILKGHVRFQPCSHSISKKGYGGLVRFGKQIAFKNNYPSPFAYDTFVFPKPVGKSKYPFDTNSKRQTFVSNTNPGYDDNIT